MLEMTSGPCQLFPPSIEKSTVCVTQHWPFFPGNWSTVVHTTPEGATCGSRSVLFCFESKTGSSRGVVQSVWVLSGSDLAVEYMGLVPRLLKLNFKMLVMW